MVAVLDLGSTAVRLAVARVRPQVGYKLLAQERVPTRLGAGRRGTLPSDAVDETLRAVRRFAKRYELNGKGTRVVAIATAAVRDAANRERLLGPLRRDQGIDVRILSPRTEARLGVEAALDSMSLRDMLVADLGGASLQLSRVRRRRIVATSSLPLGAVRMTSRFLRHDPPRQGELRALRTEVREHLARGLLPAERGEVMVALGGTVRTMARIHLRAHPGERMHRQGLTLHQSDVTAVRERFEALPPRKRRKMRGLKPERTDIILAGAVVIEEAMVFGGYLRLVVCTRGVRDGILLHETFNSRG